MDFVRSKPMPVADHFLAFSERNYSRETTVSSDAITEDDWPVLGEVCETCFVYCANKTELWRHVYDEHGADRRLVCPKPGCGKRFFAVAMSAAHAAHHEQCVTDDVRPLTCELCGHLLQNLQIFRKHMAKMHPDAVGSVCGVCYLFKGDLSSLVGHVRRRHGDIATVGTSGAVSAGHRRPLPIKKVIRCDVCGKRFGNYSNMHKHRPVHGHVGSDRRHPSVDRQ